MISANEFKRTVAEEGNVYLKEFFLYRVLRREYLQNNVGIIQSCCPMCLLTFSPDYLVFEDVTTFGYKTITERETLSLECVKSCLHSVAKFHCSTLIFEERMSRKVGTTYRVSKTYPSVFKEALFSGRHYSSVLLEGIKTGVDALINIFSNPEKIDVANLKEFAHNIIDDLPNILKPSNRFRNTICHGNLCISNMLFKFVDVKPCHCYLIDFNYYRYLPPAHDFMGMIYLSTNREFRKKHMEKVTSFYYQRMSEILKDHDLDVSTILPREEFIASCKMYKQFAIAQTFHYFPHILLTSEQRKLVHRLPGGVDRLIFGNKAYSIQKLCDVDEVYRSKLKEIVMDLEDEFNEGNSE
ncbi:hypothetical protein Trydic_g20247 [Trypoxylus dichotomus]